MFILDHHFWTRNARKLIEGSKDSDSSLVSNENFSEILWASGWALGQETWAKMNQKLFQLWCQSQKIHNPQPKHIFGVQTRKLADPFKLLSSSLAQSEELWCWFLLTMGFFYLRTWDSLRLWAWNLVCGHFISFKKGRKNLTLLTFGCPSDIFSLCARTDTMEVSFSSISSRSTTTDQHSVCDHDLNKIMAAVKVWFNEAKTLAEKIQVLILKSASQRLEVGLICGFSLFEHRVLFSVKFGNCF